MRKYGYWKIVVPLLVFILVLMFFYIRGKINDDKFFEEKINSKIISRNDWQARATEFYLSNGLRIDSSSLNKIDIQVGDSIVKDAKSWYFKVFKKNITEGYYYYKTYSLKIP